MNPPRRSLATTGRSKNGLADTHNTEVEASQDEIAKRLGMSHQAISLSLGKTMRRIRSELEKLEATEDFDHRNPDDAAIFILALRAAYAERSARVEKRTRQFCYLIKPLKFI